MESYLDITCVSRAAASQVFLNPAKLAFLLRWTVNQHMQFVELAQVGCVHDKAAQRTTLPVQDVTANVPLIRVIKHASKFKSHDQTRLDRISAINYRTSRQFSCK